MKIGFTSGFGKNHTHSIHLMTGAQQIILQPSQPMTVVGRLHYGNKLRTTNIALKNLLIKVNVTLKISGIYFGF